MGGYGKKGPSWHIGNVVHGFDSYGKDIPAFNMGGQSQITTICGGLVSIFVLFLTIVYASIKGQHLLEKKNPTIIETVLPNAIDGSTMIPLNDINFRAAFSVTGYLDGEVKNDSRYVKWVVRHRGNVDGVHFENILGIHPCTEEDYAEFNPIKSSSEETFESFKDKLFCLDSWDEYIAIGGRDGAK